MSSAFDQRVYQALAMVPSGMVVTYKEIANIIRCRSCRAIGQALRRNPYAPRVPCHRVIASDLTLGGYMGKTGGSAVKRKRELLALEGVRFVKHRLADESSLFHFNQTEIQ